MSLLRNLAEVAIAAVRQREGELQRVIDVLKPGPLGIVEHKFSDEQIRRARLAVQRARENWRKTEKQNDGTI